MPTPRPAKKKSSGIENTRTSTRTVAIEPSAIVTRLSGTAAGISTPISRNATTRTTSTPTANTSLPSVPVFQPVTDTVTPSLGPVYQPVNAETASTNPASRQSRSPMPSIPRSRTARPEDPGTVMQDSMGNPTAGVTENTSQGDAARRRTTALVGCALHCCRGAAPA